MPAPDPYPAPSTGPTKTALARASSRPAIAPGALASQSCLACAREKPLADYSLTPLWPSALGGAAIAAPFKTAAMCKSCCELAQIQIDGAFLKSWFMQAELARAAQAYLDPQDPGPAPLTYLGKIDGFPVQEGEVCDRWAGLAGEAIYHVHCGKDELWAGFGRSEEIVPEPADPGHATLVLASPSQYWSTVALLSFAAHFPFAARFCVNEFGSLQGLETGLTANCHPRELDWLRMHGHRPTIINSGLQDDFSQRFLIKLALGIGQSMFGNAFTATGYARQLRRSFWQHKPQVRPFRPAGNSFAKAGAWALCLVAHGEILGLTITTPTGKALDIVIADQPALWSGAEHDSLREGRVWIAVPQRRIFTQPYPLAECLAYQNGTTTHHGMAMLGSLRNMPRQLPGKQGFA